MINLNNVKPNQKMLLNDGVVVSVSIVGDYQVVSVDASGFMYLNDKEDGESCHGVSRFKVDNVNEDVKFGDSLTLTKGVYSKVIVVGQHEVLSIDSDGFLHLSDKDDGEICLGHEGFDVIELEQK